jgi:hypothetical protein
MKGISEMMILSLFCPTFSMKALALILMMPLPVS